MKDLILDLHLVMMLILQKRLFILLRTAKLSSLAVTEAKSLMVSFLKFLY